MYFSKKENSASRNARDSALLFTMTQNLIGDKTYQARMPSLSSRAGHTSHSLRRRLAGGDQQLHYDYSRKG